MRNAMGALILTGVIALAAAPAFSQSKAAKDTERGSLVIVFKDGRHESFRLADIVRIEFSPATTGTAVVGRARFLGDWKVGDGMGSTFTITLKPDGVARKTIGSKNTGTWTVVNGEAQVSWDDGWHDVIRKVGTKYEKAAYSPDKNLSDEPSNVAPAEYTEAH
ncbi:MAG: hypothetical protein ACE145_09840 [Terriglobia bacterium]